MRLSLLGLLLLAAVAVAWPVGAGAQAKVCAGHPKDPSVVCARDSAHIVDICDRAADGHRVFARVVTKSTYPAYRGPYYDSNDSKDGCSNLHFGSQVVSIQTCVQTEGCGGVRKTGVAPPDNTTPPPPTPTPVPTPAPTPTPAPPPPPQTGVVQLGVGLGCAPRGKRMLVTLTVHKRKGRPSRASSASSSTTARSTAGSASSPARTAAGRTAGRCRSTSRRARTTSTPAPTTSARAARSCAGRPWCAASPSARSRLIPRPARWTWHAQANVNGGWVGVGAKRARARRMSSRLAPGPSRRHSSCRDECRLNPRIGGQGDIRRVAAARSRLLPSRR